MNYTFPTITCLDDVLPAIEGASEFSVTKKDGYTVVNYFMTNPHETFPDIIENPYLAKEYKNKLDAEYNNNKATIRRECRGLIFDEDGKLISRPYHKFFNLNERTETQNINLNKPHVILEKLDGSMIRPLFLGKSKRPRWATKAGITDVSMQVETWLAEDAERSAKYERLAFYIGEDGDVYTPIFEWCSRKQRIVLDYPEDKLILTGIRNNRTGEYASFQIMREVAMFYGIPSVKMVQSYEIFEREDSEGVVIRFDDGHMVKVKTDWYVLRHKALDGLRSEKNVLKLILDNGIDDVLPLLDEATKKRVEDYTSKVTEWMALVAKQYEYQMSRFKHLERKEFAELAKQQKFPWLLFKVYDGNAALEMIKDKIKSSLSSQTTVDKIRDLIGPTW